MNKKLLVLFCFLVSAVCLGNEADNAIKNNKVKYKEAGRIDFESLLIEGERKKPELSVVTGNVGEKDSGLMVIRKDFKDMLADDFGEIIQ